MTEPTTAELLVKTPADSLLKILKKETEILLKNYEISEYRDDEATIVRLEYTPPKKI